MIKEKHNFSFTHSFKILIFPALGLINPVIRLNIVDLPTPFGPNIPKI